MLEFISKKQTQIHTPTNKYFYTNVCEKIFQNFFGEFKEKTPLSPNPFLQI